MLLVPATYGKERQAKPSKRRCEQEQASFLGLGCISSHASRDSR